MNGTNRIATIFALFTISTLYASAVSIGNFSYRLDSNRLTAEVTGTSISSGDMIIPSSVTYGDKTYRVTSIGDNAFYDYYEEGKISIDELYIPASITTIGEGAFEIISSIKKFVFEASGNPLYMAFYEADEYDDYPYNWSIETLILGRDIPCSKIEDGYCFPRSVKNVSIGKEVGDISCCLSCQGLTASSFDAENENFVFYNNAVYNQDKSKLIRAFNPSSFSISSNTTEIGPAAFYCCDKLQGTINIGYRITSIGKCAFFGCSNITSVTMADNDTSIGSHAFESCSSLQSVTLPNGLTHIPASMFYSCDKLTSLILPASVETIGYNAFGYGTIRNYTCYSTAPPVFSEETLMAGATVHVKRGYKSTYTKAAVWKNGIIVEDLVLAEGTCGDTTSWFFEKDGMLTVTGSGAMYDFNGNSSNPWWNYIGSITSVTITDGITSIGKASFFNYTRLKDIHIGKDVKTIGEMAFYATALTNVSLPDGLVSIGAHSFEGCHDLQNINIPQSVTDIGDYAFNLSNTSLPIIDGLRYADTYLIEAVDKTISSAKIKGGTRFIGRSAFEDCECLTAVSIPESVTGIFGLAFKRCSSLKKITIPHHVQIIDESAFVYADKLWIVICLADQVPTLVNTVFNDYTKTKGYLFVQKSLLDDYKEATEWKDFSNIAMFIPNGDANKDGDIGISDLSTMIQKRNSGKDAASLLEDTPTLDANNDGRFDESDITFLVNYILNRQ